MEMFMTIPKKVTIKIEGEHGFRYNDLVEKLTVRQRSDRSYLAACYILSADEEIFDFARDFVSDDGIEFAKIRMWVKKKYGQGSTEYTAIEVGYSLFSWRDCSVNPHEMAQSGCFWLPIICNALLLQGGSGEIEVA